MKLVDWRADVWALSLILIAFLSSSDTLFENSFESLQRRLR
jgi:hypothetical protein